MKQLNIHSVSALVGIAMDCLSLAPQTSPVQCSSGVVSTYFQVELQRTKLPSGHADRCRFTCCNKTGEDWLILTDLLCTYCSTGLYGEQSAE